MKASELIRDLQKLIAGWGDCPVKVITLDKSGHPIPEATSELEFDVGYPLAFTVLDSNDES